MAAAGSETSNAALIGGEAMADRLVEVYDGPTGSATEVIRPTAGSDHMSVDGADGAAEPDDLTRSAWIRARQRQRLQTTMDPRKEMKRIR